jgi:hypothetical protein
MQLLHTYFSQMFTFPKWPESWRLALGHGDKAAIIMSQAIIVRIPTRKALLSQRHCQNLGVRPARERHAPRKNRSNQSRTVVM